MDVPMVGKMDAKRDLKSAILKVNQMEHMKVSNLDRKLDLQEGLQWE